MIPAAFFLYRPCGDLTQDDIIYKAPEGSCLPGYCPEPGDIIVTKNRDGTGPFHCVPAEDMRPVLVIFWSTEAKKEWLAAAKKGDPKPWVIDPSSEWPFA